MVLLFYTFIPWNWIFFILIFIFAFQVGAGRFNPNTKPKVHTGIYLLFVDVSKNLRVPSISASSSDVSQWNKQFSTYFEILFAFANANFHDNNVLVFAHDVDLDGSRSIHN